MHTFFNMFFVRRYRFRISEHLRKSIIQHETIKIQYIQLRYLYYHFQIYQNYLNRLHKRRKLFQAH
eukprot:UN09485